MIKVNIILFSIIFLFFIGCSSSDEAMQEAETARAAEMEIIKLKNSDITNENSQLKQQITRLEQDVRTLTAKAADLESKMAEEKIKVKATPPPPQVKDFDFEYQEALSLFKQRKYQESADKLQAIINAGVRTTLEDNCNYWIGENYYGMKKHETAIKYFEKIFNYKVTEKKDDSAIMIANCNWEMGNKSEALKLYKEFIEKFPASPYTQIVKARAGK